MKTYYLLFFTIFLEFSDARKQSFENSTTYIAGVVEYYPNRDLTIYDRLENNLENYVHFINLAKGKSVDIVVFPEATFNRYDEGPIDVYKGIAFNVPHENKGVIPCDQPTKYNKMLKDISCSAKDHKIYVVINVVERVDCNKTKDEKCPEHNFYLFNTNVVFDRQGMIVSRYRKINLFGEPGFTPSIGQELGVFETDFGVKFGHFICFDLMFQKPAVEILNKERVRDIVFPSMWFSELPFLTAVQIQESWAYTHNVNLLAAGANNPKVGSTGSGIYSGRKGQIIAVMRGNITRQMLVAEVPKIPGTNLTKKFTNMRIKQRLDTPVMMDTLYLKKDNINIYNSHLLDMNETQVFSLTHGDVDCAFRITLNTSFPSANEQGKHNYKYRAMVFDGVRSYTYKNGGNLNCALVACTNSSIRSCAMRFPNYLTIKQTFEIESIEIVASVPKPIYNETLQADNIVYYPVTLDTRILPLDLTTFEFTTTDAVTSATRQVLKMTLHEPQSELLTFGFMGRAFDRDDLPASTASTSYSSFVTMLTMVFLANCLRNFV